MPKKQDGSRATEDESFRVDQVSDKFMPFQVKADMKVAPAYRRLLSCEEKTKLIALMDGQATTDKSQLYLREIHSRPIQKSGKTWLWERKDDVIIIGEAL